MQYRLFGQSLVEYSLVATLVIVVAIPGILLMSGTLNNQFSSMLSFGSDVQPLEIFKPKTTAIKTNLPAGSSSQADTVKATQEKSQAVNAATQEAIQVLGANGDTKALASSLQAIASAGD